MPSVRGYLLANGRAGFVELYDTPPTSIPTSSTSSTSRPNLPPAPSDGRPKNQYRPAKHPNRSYQPTVTDHRRIEMELKLAHPTDGKTSLPSTSRRSLNLLRSISLALRSCLFRRRLPIYQTYATWALMILSCHAGVGLAELRTGNEPCVLLVSLVRSRHPSR